MGLIVYSINFLGFFAVALPWCFEVFCRRLTVCFIGLDLFCVRCLCVWLYCLMFTKLLFLGLFAYCAAARLLGCLLPVCCFVVLCLRFVWVLGLVVACLG